jgi:hypothetical protein
MKNLCSDSLIKMWNRSRHLYLFGYNYDKHPKIKPDLFVEIWDIQLNNSTRSDKLKGHITSIIRTLQNEIDHGTNKNK